MRRVSFLLPILLLALPAGARGSVDPFYDRLYRDGLNARAAGENALAARKLRLACFGMLDDPPALSACSGQLALAYAAAGDKDALRGTVDRLLELERIHQGLSKASAAGGISPADRDAVEDLIRANAAPQAVVDIPAFRLLALRMLPPADRFRELDRRIAQDSRNYDWRQLMAEHLYEQRQFPDALRAVEHALALRPESEASRCLQGLVTAEMGNCGDETLGNLGHCRPPSQTGATLKMTSCQIGRADAAAARAAFERLPTAERTGEAAKAVEKELVKLEKKAGG